MKAYNVITASLGNKYSYWPLSNDPVIIYVDPDHEDDEDERCIFHVCDVENYINMIKKPSARYGETCGWIVKDRCEACAIEIPRRIIVQSEIMKNRRNLRIT